MMTIQPNLTKQEKMESIKSQGCGTILLFVFSSLMVLMLSGVDIFLTYIDEQAMFETSVGIGDFRWISHLIYSLAVLIPLILLSIVVKSPRNRLIYRLWMLAAIFALLCLPVRFMYLSSQNQTSVLQIGAMLILLIGVKLFTKPDQENQKSDHRVLGLGALVGLGASIPWVLWGSLGSVFDTVLSLITGILFGITVVEIVFPLYLKFTQSGENTPGIGNILLDGFVIAMFLLILTTGLGCNGSEVLYVITIPVTGWLIAIFSATGMGKRSQGKISGGLIVAMAFTLPALFFDMDELSMVISGSAGEVMGWANKAALYTFMIFWLAIIMLLINHKNLVRMNLPRKWNLLMVIACGIGLTIFYLISGNVGFYGDKLFVIFNAQPGLSSIKGDTPLETRKAEIYQLLTSTAEDTQKEIRAKLDKWGVSYTPYYLLNGMEVSCGPIVQMILRNDPSVDRILESPNLRPLPEKVPTPTGELQSKPDETPWNLEMIEALKVHQELGITGKGIIIGQTDSGADGRHIELAESYRGYGSKDDYNWLDPWHGTTFPVDRMGHGTSTLGIEVGKTLGIAPDAKWIGCVNLARNLGNPARYLDCMQFMFAPYPQDGDAFTDGDTTRGVMIINNSWGCPKIEGCDPEVYASTMHTLKLAGIFMSAAAGNTGYYGCSTVSDPPAIYADVFTAGAVDKSGEITKFSSLGPVLVDGSGRSKPDILAPGEEVLLAAPGNQYTYASGTSFAAPHVTGVVALIWSANPSLIGNIDATMEILRESAKPYTGTEPDCGNPSFGSGAGVLDAYNAVKSAMEWKE